MSQTTVPPVRVGARVLAFVVAGMAALSLVYACAETKRSPGDECLKSADCLSGICQQLVCASQGPLTDAMLQNPEAGQQADTGTAGEGSTSDAPADTGSAAETGGDSSGGSEGGSDGAPEASGD
jgi:hypothetical protein